MLLRCGRDVKDPCGFLKAVIGQSVIYQALEFGRYGKSHDANFFNGDAPFDHDVLRCVVADDKGVCPALEPGLVDGDRVGDHCGDGKRQFLETSDDGLKKLAVKWIGVHDGVGLPLFQCALQCQHCFTEYAERVVFVADGIRQIVV